MTSEQLFKFVTGEGVPTNVITLPDEELSLPAREWITGDFAASWVDVLNGFRFKYQEESEDCDDFARGCAWWAQFLHNRTRPGGSALAFAECHYMQDSGGGHAIVAAVCKVGPALKLLFFEPQPSVVNGGFAAKALEPVELTKCELSNIFFLRF